ncbi:MAG: E2/UBC family protein [Dongiaceae bacterium]
MSLRRQFDLPPEDVKFLDDYDLPWEAIVDGSPWVLIHEFATHEGYDHPKVTTAIRIETGYPVTALDMVYVYPALARKDGKSINNVNATQNIDGKIFQRWSRHRTQQNPWKSGEDNIGSHVHLIEDWLEREFNK